MDKKTCVRAAISALTFIFALGLVLPAQAFYMEVPQSLKILQAPKKIQGSITLTQTTGDSGGSVAPIPMAPQIPGGPGPEGGGGTGGSIPPPPQPYQGLQPQQPPQPPQQQPYQGMMPQQNQNNQQNQPWANMCSNNTELACVDGTGKFVASAKVGSDGQPICPANSSAQCGNYQQNNQQNGQMGPGGGGNGGQMGPGGQNQMMGQQGPSEEQQKQQQERQMKDMKRGVNQMQSNIKQFEKIMTAAEKKGVVIPPDVKDNLNKAKQIISALTTATTPEEMQNAGINDLQDLMQSLDEARQNVIEAAQRVQQVQQGMKGLDSGLKMYDKLIAKLTKQGIAIPADIADNLNQVKTIVAAVKAAKTWEEMQNAGIDDLQDLMQTLDQNRQQLDALSRWPQTLKQVDSILKQLNTELKRDKAVVTKLAKKNIDLAGIYSDFETAVNQLKSVRDDAVTKMQAGQAEDAFNALQDDFFGQTNDVWQSAQVIQMMNNLGGFNSQFKQNVSKAKQQISNLKKQKIETGELEDLLAQAQAKGQEILDLMKVKPVDTDSIMNSMEELQTLQQDFSDKVSELTGGETVMPWEQGPQQFNQISLPSSVGKYIQQPQQGGGQMMAPGTSGGGGGMVNP